MSERTYRRHAEYREAQLLPEFSQFLDKNRNNNSVVNADSTMSTGRKRRADESVGYLAGDMQMAMKEQRLEGNYEAGGRSQSLDVSDLVRRNANYRVNTSLI